MGSAADYLEKKLLDGALGGADFVRPATVYVGLSTTTITDAGGSITEPSGNGYARVAVTNNSTNFPAASGAGAAKSNGTAITFPTATGSWGTVTDWFISDASSGGNIMFDGALASSRAVANGDTPSFAAGDLAFTCD